MKIETLLLVFILHSCAPSTHYVSPWKDISLPQSIEATSEDIIKRHLEAIGKKEDRNNVSARRVRGNLTRSSIVGPGGQIKATAEIISTNPKIRFSIKLTEPKDLHDEMVYDGKRVISERVPLRSRSDLTFFLYWQTLPLKEGLFCGLLSTAWPLLRSEKSKLSYQGIKMMVGKQLHSIEYRKRSGASDIKVMLYFDTITFRHLRTEYKFEGKLPFNVAPGATPDFIESRYVLTEEFDDFRIIDGLMLPHKYKLRLTEESRLESKITEWLMNVEEISHNELTEEKDFKVK